MELINQPKGYEKLVNQISETYIQGRAKAVNAVNVSMLETYWQIGQYIVEFEQDGKLKAEYGKALLKNLAKDLSEVHGKGFSMSNVYLMRQFFIKYPKFQTLSGKFKSLSWSHFCELIPIDNDLERQFYEVQCQRENWNVRELKRQKKSSLFLRLASSQDKEGILKLANEGHLIEKPEDLLKDPYVFEFLKIPEPYHISETELEKRLIENLQHFLLEMGKGFAFIGRQYRITLGNTHYYVDLVFYHRILKCFVLIDLKKEKAGYEDVGQMNMYLGYFDLTTMSSTGSATNTGSFPTNTHDMINSVTIPPTDPTTIVAVGINASNNSGDVFTATIGTYTTTPVWQDSSSNVSPLPLRDIEETDLGTMVAVGDQGTMLHSLDGTNWTQLISQTAVNLNSFCVDPVEPYISYGQSYGLVAGNKGSLWEFDLDYYNVLDMYPVNLNNSTHSNLYDIKINMSQHAYIAGAAGTLLYIKNIDPSVTSFDYGYGNPHPSNVDFHGIDMNDADYIFTVGDKSAIYSYYVSSSTNISGTKIKDVFTPHLRDVNFLDNLNGYAIGDLGTIRHTGNGGVTWNIITQKVFTHSFSYYAPYYSPRLNRIWVTHPDSAYIVGEGSTLLHINSKRVVDYLSSYTYGNTSINAIAFGNNRIGYILGGTSLFWTLDINASNYNHVGHPVMTGIISPGSFDFLGIHVFNNNTFVAVGKSSNPTDPKIYTYNKAYGTPFQSQNLGIPSTTVLNSVHFWDDRTGYVGGNIPGVSGGGRLYKCSNSANVWDYSDPSSHPDHVQWISEGGTVDADGITLTTTNTLNVTVVCLTSHYDGFIGGQWSSETYNPSYAHPYARNIHDESLLYSTYFWYDRLGRMVISQNTKQYNATRKRYSYTLYDVLGRIKEVGEKTENCTDSSDYIGFPRIFGTFVNNFYNPNVINDDSLNAWVNAESYSTKGQITRTYYDNQRILPTSIMNQNNLRKRVASVTYADKYSSDSTVYDHATHYTYDIHGNVNTLIQENPHVHWVTPSQVYKRIDYRYDLVSGNVNAVDYQPGQLDQFHHRYEYDADNRITDVYTSRDSVIWDHDAKYFYYKHGPLARIELGDNQVQGIDYAYTLQGWIKGVNSDLVKPGNDMGQDGNGFVSSINGNFANDAFGYSLEYYTNDYLPISSSASFLSNRTGSSLLAARHNLWNGNITDMVTSIPVVATPSGASPTFTAIPQGTAYKYDQLNRLIEMQAYQNINSTTNTWGTMTYNKYFWNRFSYDANGNIATQDRYNKSGTQIDSMTYRYHNDGTNKIQNRLYSVNDHVASGAFSDDIDDMGTFHDTGLADVEANNNYGYDKIGNLNKDLKEEIANIDWTVSGKIKKITRTTGSIKSDLYFDYDAMGNRVTKLEMTKNHSTGALNVPDKWITTYYVRDATGKQMAVYKQHFDGYGAYYQLIEHDMYGSSRLGTDDSTIEMIYPPPPNPNYFGRKLGFKHYEASNHLGNVLATFTDRKIPYGSGMWIDHWVPEVISATDYSPFGVALDSRNFSSTSYRYGFNGKEKDDEVKGAGDSYDYGMRMQDTRIGRFLSIDPLFKKYPELTPYQFVSNRPIDGIDLDGKEWQWATGAAAFVIDASVQFSVAMLYNGNDFGDAFRSIDWADATISGIAGAVTVVGAESTIGRSATNASLRQIAKTAAIIAIPKAGIDLTIKDGLKVVGGDKPNNKTLQKFSTDYALQIMDGITEGTNSDPSGPIAGGLFGYASKTKDDLDVNNVASSNTTSNAANNSVSPSTPVKNTPPPTNNQSSKNMSNKFNEMEPRKVIGPGSAPPAFTPYSAPTETDNTTQNH